MQIPFVAESQALPDQRESGVCLDLSQKGASILVGQSLGIGSPIRVTLQLYAVPLLKLEGRIAWVRERSGASGWAMGIEFDGELPGELVTEIGGAGPPGP